MNKSIASTVRAVFALFMLGVGMYAGIDSLVAAELNNRGLSSCGSAENPCALAPLKVTTTRPAGRLVNSAADAGSVQVLGNALRAAAPETAMAES